MLDRIRKYIFWPLISILIFVIMVEASLILFDINPHPKSRQFTVNRAPDYPEVFLKDAQLLWRLRPGQTITSEFFQGKTYRINRQGFRGDDFNSEKEGLRLAVLGNSCAFGWGVSEEETFARRLENKISRAEGNGAEVLNFSVPGYSSFQGVGNYAEMVRFYRPDILLVTFGWNDQWLSADDCPDKEQRTPPGPIIILQNHLARLRLYRLMQAMIYSTLPEPEYLKVKSRIPRVSLEDFQSNLGDIIRMAEGDGARVVLLTSPIPSLESYYGLDHKSVLHETHRYYNEIMKNTAALYSVGLVDLAAVFDRYDNLFDNVAKDPFHYNSRGHAVAAEAIFDFLVNSGMIGGEG